MTHWIATPTRADEVVVGDVIEDNDHLLWMITDIADYPPEHPLSPCVVQVWRCGDQLSMSLLPDSNLFVLLREGGGLI